MQKSLDSFLGSLRTERQLSPHTVSAYTRDLSAVSVWCENESIQQWSELTNIQASLRCLPSKESADYLGAVFNEPCLL